MRFHDLAEQIPSDGPAWSLIAKLEEWGCKCFYVEPDEQTKTYGQDVAEFFAPFLDAHDEHVVTGATICSKDMLVFVRNQHGTVIGLAPVSFVESACEPGRKGVLIEELLVLKSCNNFGYYVTLRCLIRGVETFAASDLAPCTSPSRTGSFFTVAPCRLYDVPLSGFERSRANDWPAVDPERRLCERLYLAPVPLISPPPLDFYPDSADEEDDLSACSPRDDPPGDLSPCEAHQGSPRSAV